MEKTIPSFLFIVTVDEEMLEVKRGRPAVMDVSRQKPNTH
jgi:hypothetical protein